MSKISSGFEPLIGIDDVCEYLGDIPKKTVYKWSSESRINGFPVYKTGRHLRFRKSEIDTWLRNQCRN
ncbi:MAG: helix-turn-helix domain-containing protein [PVC group bacterium]|nr:helix-turn-helix domain-containing protein [PVC group bacterium]